MNEVSPEPSQAQAQMYPCILLVAGEPSGDAHGAELIRSLKTMAPDVRCIGCGGPHMRAAGQEQLLDLSAHAVVGFVEVMRHYPKFNKFMKQIVALAQSEKPEIVVLIDYPGFNLRLAKTLRALLPQSRIVYYISPQVWAWKAGRAKAMQKNIDLLLSIFPFERDWFSKHAPHLKVEWVGHPALDRIIPVPDNTQVPKRIALLPGSRANEIRMHWPVLCKTAQILSRQKPGLKFAWVTPNAALQKLGLELLKQTATKDFVLESYIGYPLTHLGRCELALVASGTASLECALVGVPPIVFYKVNALTYEVGRRLVKVKYLSMINVLAGKGIVPEFIQKTLNPQALANETSILLDNPKARDEIRQQMREVVLSLGKPGANERAATHILTELADVLKKRAEIANAIGGSVPSPANPG